MVIRAAGAPENRSSASSRARALVPASLCRPLLLEPAPHDVVAVIWCDRHHSLGRYL